MLEKYSTIAFWYDRSFTMGIKWDTAARYLILEPTGPKCKSYWAMYRTWCGATPKKIRLSANHSGIQLTEQEYKERYALCLKL